MGRAQENFHTPPIVVALQTPAEHASATRRCRGGARPTVWGWQERVERARAGVCVRGRGRDGWMDRERAGEGRKGEREREKEQLVTDPVGASSSQFVSLIGGLAPLCATQMRVFFFFFRSLSGTRPVRKKFEYDQVCCCFFGSSFCLTAFKPLSNLTLLSDGKMS